MGSDPIYSALVLTAGLGTRLQPLSLVRAKPAVPIAGQPLVSRIIRWLAGQDVRDLVLNLHHLPDTITRHVGDGSPLGARVRYSWEFPILGSAGGPRKALPLLPDDNFFIINGDTLTDVDLMALAKSHRESGALVTMAVLGDKALAARYGGVVTDARGTVHGFVPKGPSAVGYHFVGVQMVHPSVFARLAPEVPAETTRGVYRDLIAERPGSIRAFLAGGAFWDVGTASEYLNAALTIGRHEGAPTPQIGSDSRAEPTAEIIDSVIWDNVRVGAGARLERCVVADGVAIPDSARYQNCAIIQDGAGALIVAEMTDG
jgi:NDP-sugar pyrophosphorylase family protein